MLLGAFLAILVMLMPASAASVEKRTFWADDGDNTPFVCLLYTSPSPRDPR